jgi:transcriptional regulator GlxA family with amidase domain
LPKGTASTALLPLPKPNNNFIDAEACKKVFVRFFINEMKTTSARLVERLRVEAARRRLEESQNDMEMIADECGFGNVNLMRNLFQRTLRIAPGQYRRHFSSREALKGKLKANYGVTAG